MLTVSLHGIHIHAPHGLYPQEHILGNDFEIDVDIWLPVLDGHAWPFVDYTMIREVVADTFAQPGQLLETFTQNIHAALKLKAPIAEKIRVAVKKLHPPMQGDVAFAQICYEA